jgi:hypothetical protein
LTHVKTQNIIQFGIRKQFKPKKLNASKHFIILSAKAWGDHCGERILAVHGLADNAATFDMIEMGWGRF